MVAPFVLALMDRKKLTARTSDDHSTFVEFSLLLNSIY
jgi:hypothetical protein